MKVEILKDGILRIKAENDLESYALIHWCKENEGKIPPGMLIISSYE